MCVDEGPPNCPKNRFECDDHMPINISITGEWRPVSSTDTSTYLQRRGGTPYQDVLFQLASHKFSFFNGKFCHSQMFKNEKLHETIGILGYQNDRSKNVTKTRIEKNRLLTSTYWKETDHHETEERFIKNGQLNIVNNGFGCTCIRVFDRVEVFDLTIKDYKPIEQELPGLWKKYAHTGLREFVRCHRLDSNFQLLWETGYQSFKIIGNAVLMNHFVTEEPFISNSQEAFLRCPVVADGVASVTCFEDNSLVTLEIEVKTDRVLSRMVRFVLDGKLFIVKYKGGVSIVFVYEKIN
ncbi:unnamed protein product [Caenorhabditis brenneri]